MLRMRWRIPFGKAVKSIFYDMGLNYDMFQISTNQSIGLFTL